MKQWALIDPQGTVSAMANSWEALEEMREVLPDDARWRIVPADLRFWEDHPELTQGDSRG